MEKLKCLGCGGVGDFSFVLLLNHACGAEKKSHTFGACVLCTEPGSRNYEEFRRRLGTVMFMEKNVLIGMATNSGSHGIVDAKTAAAGGDL